MKKNILLIIMLLPSLEMMAQSLVGSWEERINNKVVSSLVFDPKGTMACYFYNEKPDENGVMRSMTFCMPGTYTRAGQMVHIKFLRHKITMSLDDKTMQGMDEEQRALALYTVEQYRLAYAKSLPETSTSKIKSITAKDLTFELLGTERKYKKVASH